MPVIKANEIDICYEDHGDAKNPCILLVMGIGSQLINWPLTYVERLVNHGFRVICFDNRDIGLSQYFDQHPIPPIDKVIKAVVGGQKADVPYRLGDMASDAIGLLDSLGIEKAHAVGISMGGMIVQHMALSHGARLHSMISIASTTGNPNLPPATKEAMKALTAPPLNKDDRDGIVARMVETAQIMAGAGGLCNALETLKAHAEKSYDRSYHPQGFGRQYAAIIADGDRRQRLAAIKVPTLVIHGTTDPLIPLAAGEDTHQAIPAAQLACVANMGHALPDDLAEEITALIANFASQQN